MPGSRRFDRIADWTRDARRRLSTDSSAAALRMAATFELQWINAASTNLDRAVDDLERARATAPRDGDVLNDLAVAYLEVAQREQDLRPMLRALDVVERAARRDSFALPVLFNRALVRQRLYLVSGARRAWTQYLRLEPDPRWRGEAERYVAALRAFVDTTSWPDAGRIASIGVDAPLRAAMAAHARRDPQGARAFGFALLGAWGGAWRSEQRSAARNLLGATRDLADMLDAVKADRSLARALEAIGDSARRDAGIDDLAAAHADLSEGIAFYDRAERDSALTRFVRAESAFERHHSAAADWASYYRALTELNLAAPTIAERRFRRLLPRIPDNEPALTGKTLASLGVVEARRGDYEHANRLYDAARPYFLRLGERENVGSLSYVRAEGLLRVGRTGAGRRDAYTALALLSPFRRSNFLNNHLSNVALYARQDGLSYAALALMDEVMSVAPAVGKAEVVALALCSRADDLASIGEDSAAAVDVDRAERIADAVTGHPRTLVRAVASLARGQLLRRYDPHTALRVLANATRLADSLHVTFLGVKAAYEAAVAAHAAADSAAERHWLLDAIDRVERQQASFESAENRVSLYETVDDLFDAMISLQLAARDSARAFEYLERERIAVWPRRTPAVEGLRRSPTLARVAGRMPEHSAFIEYAVLRDRLVAWSVSPRGVRCHIAAVPRDSIAMLVDRLERESTDASPVNAQARAQLFDILIAPLLEQAPDVRALSIVPDRELLRVPFAALWNRTTRRYVVEDYVIQTEPSVVFLFAGGRVTVTAGSSMALVVGSPLTGTAAGEKLQPLPNARREAHRVATLYAGATLITDAAATVDTIRRLLPRAAVFHFAGHALVNAERPELSFLALSASSDSTGMLTAREIAAMRLSKLRIAVLSACNTLGGRATRGGGVAGLAFSFLEAGAPATISSLWDVSDQVTQDLLVRFHQYFQAGSPAPDALRRAQRDMMRSADGLPRAPAAWSAFIYTGP